MRRIVLLGYGSLGQYIHSQAVQGELDAIIVGVWNRSDFQLDHDNVLTSKAYGDVDLIKFITDCTPDLIVECSHRSISELYIQSFLNSADYMPTSLTAFANQELWEKYILKSHTYSGQLVIPSGAAWGLSDIERMSMSKSIAKIQISMSFGASALKLTDESYLPNSSVQKSKSNEKLLVAEGSLIHLAKLAPQNVNTMIAVAIAAKTIDPNIISGALYLNNSDEAHTVVITLTGHDGFEVSSKRVNPARHGAVTGSMTFVTFLNSLRQYIGGNTGRIQLN